MDEDVEKTTVQVTKPFAEMLRNEFSGRNDMERLENWKQSSDDSVTNEDIREAIKNIDYKNPITQEEVRRACEEAIRNVQR